jgi:hypothetical protein
VIATVLAVFDGIAFDPFFRGLLSVLVGVVVLFGGIYLVIATNSGSRLGGLIAGASLFGWMFLMGAVWTIYGIGWKGEAESWELVEIHSGDLALAETEEAVDLATGLTSFTPDVGDIDDPDLRQLAAVFTAAQSGAGGVGGWKYLATSDSKRGEAQAAADVFLIDNHIFDSSAEYVPLQFGGFGRGGKDAAKTQEGQQVIDLAPEALPWYTRVWHGAGNKLHTTILQPWHPQELVAIQVQGVIEQPTLPGEAPPLPEADPDKAVKTVIIERDRGGPIPAWIGGERFTPFVFTIFNGIIFGIMAWLLHTRDKREMSARAASA